MVVLSISSQPQGARPPIPVPPLSPRGSGPSTLPDTVTDCVDSLKGIAAYQQNFVAAQPPLRVSK
jgi:hypothetical protein